MEEKEGCERMIEKLIPIGFILIIVGAFSFVVEYILFGTKYMILIAYFGLILSAIPLGAILIRRNKEGAKE